MAMVMPTRMVPETILASIKRARPLYQAARTARQALGSRLGAAYISELGSRAHYNDTMLASRQPEDVVNYRRVALEVVDILRDGLARAGRSFEDIGACLEVGCGYGRIVRELRHRLRPGTISVCDLVEEAARFTAAEFGARKLPVVEALGPEHDANFDLVYLLGVYSHLPRPALSASLTKVASLVKPGGVLVFTAHGEQSAAIAESYGQSWLDASKLRAALARDGFFYERYPYYYSDYGVTWVAAAEMQRIVAAAAPALDLVDHRPMAVEGHQDVFVYRRR